MKTTTYTLPTDLVAELDSFSPPGFGPSRVTWTEEADQVVLQYWGKIRREDLLSVFKQRYGFGSKNTLLTRFKLLTENENRTRKNPR